MSPPLKGVVRVLIMVFEMIGLERCIAYEAEPAIKTYGWSKLPQCTMNMNRAFSKLSCHSLVRGI